MDTAPRITRIIGVYNADGTLRGELTYLVGKLRGTAHCGLCDITHSTVRRRPEWLECASLLPVAFDTYHRDDQPDAARPHTDGSLPAVLADTDAGVVPLLGPADLDACAASPERLIDAVRTAADGLGLRWPD
ncbi:MAG: hypothetical protein ACKOAZ_01515 [Ilumatobacteraceae bacterium]